MRKIALITLLSLPLVAHFFPATMQSSIKSAKNGNILLTKAFPVNGMSGVVVHTYDNGLDAIVSRISQTDTKGFARLISADIIHHDELPTIKTAVQKGDKVIGGYLYNNVLILAPDADTYTDVTRSYHKRWIHPDLFALFLSTEKEEKPTKENLARFAKKYQVGLIYIIRKDAAVLLDPFSGEIIAQKAISKVPKEGKFPFYMRFDHLESGWFGGTATGDYYKTMDTL